LGKIYKGIFARAAARLESQAQAASRDLMRATTHWLRHTHSNHALDRGAELRDVRAILGHASLSTTALYVSDAARRRRAIDALLLGTDVESTE
jgi:site-specific recombinase XerD